MHLDRRLVRGDVDLTGTPAGIGMRLNVVQRRIAQLVKDRFRKAELLVSSYATSNALLRPGRRRRSRSRSGGNRAGAVDRMMR